MSSLLKGFAAEDFLATIFTVILLMFFIIAVVNTYQTHLRDLDIQEQANAAGVFSRKIFFDNQGVIRNLSADFSFGKNTRVVIKDLESGENYTHGNITNSTNSLSSALAILIYNSSQNKYTQGRLEVYVGK